MQIPVSSRVIDLKIDAVSQVIDPNNRTFEIEILIPCSEERPKPNMLAVVTINDYTNPEALTVPQNVVQETGSEQFLFRDRKTHRAGSPAEDGLNRRKLADSSRDPVRARGR